MLQSIVHIALVEQEFFIGNQAGGRVFLFLNTDNFWRDYHQMVSRGIEFVREPKEEAYGIVAVFKDLYGKPVGPAADERRPPDFQADTMIAQHCRPGHWTPNVSRR